MKKTKLIIVSLVTIISVVLMMMAGFTACPQTATTEETTTTTLGFYFEITSIWTTDDANWNNYSTGWDNDLKMDGKFVIAMPGSNIEVSGDGAPCYGYVGFGYSNFSFDRTNDVTTTEKELTSDETGKPTAGGAYLVETIDGKAKIIFRPQNALFSAVEAKNNATGLNETIFKSGSGYDVYVIGEWSNCFGTPIDSVGFWGQKISKMIKTIKE